MSGIIGRAQSTAGSGIISREHNNILAVLKKTSAQTFTGSQLMTFDGVVYNIGGGWNSSNHQFTPPRAGFYQIFWGGTSKAGSDTVWRANLFVGGSDTLQQLRLDNGDGTGYTWGSRTEFLYLGVNDVLEMRGAVDGDGSWYADATLHMDFNIKYEGTFPNTTFD